MVVGPLAVAAIVPTTDAAGRAQACVQALARQHAPLQDIVVVQSGGAGWSFASTLNQAIRGLASPWVLVVNDDAILAEDFVERLLAGLPDDPHIGVACGRLLSADGKRIDSTGQFRRRNWTARERGHGELDRGQYREPGYVESACAAAALYRREMLEDVAVDGRYFDERFEMYLEDLDLGLRAKRRGWRAYYVPDAVGTHTRGATAKRSPQAEVRGAGWLGRYYLAHVPDSRVACYVRSRYRLMRKHASWRDILRDLPWILWYECRLWAFILVCRPAALPALLRRARSP